MRKRRLYREWERQNQAHRVAYYRDYHAAHRAERNAAAIERVRARDRRDPQARRAYRQRAALELKVCQNWHCSIDQARALIEQGRFPE